MEDIAKHSSAAKTSEFARTSDSVESVAKVGKTDAVSAGLVKQTGDTAKSVLSDGNRSSKVLKSAASKTLRSGAGSDADAGDQAAGNIASQAATAMQSHRNMRLKIGAVAAAEMDEADETQGASDVYSAASDASSLRRRRAEISAAKSAGDAKKAQIAGTSCPSNSAAAAKAKGNAAGVSKVKAAEANAKMQSRRTWLKAHAAQAKAAETGAATVAKAEGGKTIAAIASSALAPLAGVLAGILAFVLAMMVVSQLISALFGFWENEASKQSLAGLPPYITQEMVVTALECQEKYGHPAGCTIAQIICESGVGDHLSGLATQDNNLFGIKWASSYGLAEEVTGHSSWQTGEEYNGQHVTIMDEFTSFKSHKDCIIFRSRVFLQNSRYSQNALIKEAMEKHDSDKMAEGLKDAGYATSSEYVQTLQSIMKTYNLYRFDGMTVEQYESMAANGDAIVQAAYSQLGVPYVWGGETPGVGLDCSGLTMYCYSTVGISIPHYTEDQYAMGTPKLLSEAQPGDILYKPGHVAIYVGGDQYIHEPHSGAVCTLATGINYFTCALSFR